MKSSTAENKLYIKNMVCPRCISAVKNVLNDLNISFVNVELGHVKLNAPLEKSTSETLKSKLDILGFELLESANSTLISKIKTLVIQQIHHSKEPMKVNFSTFLSEKLHQDYAGLSRLFSSVEGITIEKFITQQKIERIKELLYYDELSLAQIADQMNYNSVAYLSATFKKETGMTISSFKNNKAISRKTIDSI